MKKTFVSSCEKKSKNISIICLIKPPAGFMTIQKSKSLIQIADELEEEPTDIQSLYECVTQNIKLTVEEIYKIYISTNKTNN